MNTDLAIAVVTSVINDIVGTATGHNVSNLSPASPPTNAEPHIYVCLYQVVQNPHLINQDLPTRRGDGSLRNRPRIALDLNYLFTFYGSESELVSQRLLGTTMRALHAQPILSRERIAHVIESNEYLKFYDPEECFETIRISPHPLSLEDMSKLWSIFFQKPHALSVAYQASVVLIEAEESISVPLPVVQPKVYVLPIHRPVIEQITVAGDDPRIFPDSTIVITGRDLSGDVTKIRINNQEKVVQPETDERITVNLSVSAGLQAGVCGVQVIHATLMGEPQELREVIESNVIAVVVHPKIESSPQTQPGALRVTMTHPVGPSQKVYLLLNSISAGGGFSFPASQRTVNTSEIDFQVLGLKGDRYLVRVQVDGAESPIDFNQQSPQILIYVIRGDENDSPKYKAPDKTLTLKVDPEVEAGGTGLSKELIIEKTDGSVDIPAIFDQIEDDKHTLVFHFSNPVEPGLYRIKLTIGGIQALNQPEIDI